MLSEVSASKNISSTSLWLSCAEKTHFMFPLISMLTSLPSFVPKTISLLPSSSISSTIGLDKSNDPESYFQFSSILPDFLPSMFLKAKVIFMIKNLIALYLNLLKYAKYLTREKQLFLNDNEYY